VSRRYLVVSDLHLCDIECHADGWKAYKHPRFLFDQAFDDLVASFAGKADENEHLVLVLNGDIFDFDLVTAIPDDPPWPVSRAERARGLDPTEAKSAWKLEHMLADHPLFLQTLARFLDAGHHVVYVIGNHDPEMHFPAVQNVLRQALTRRADELGLSVGPERLQIEPWFYHVAGEIYVEHGQQYDHYTSFRHVLSPLIDTKPKRVALPMGDLSNRYLMSHMGFFNPHASDYILNIYRYVMHWVRHYAFNSKRHLVVPWFLGSLAVLWRMLALKRLIRTRGPNQKQLLAKESIRKGLSITTLQRLDGLRRAPIANRLYRMVREFWIDRLLLAALMTGGTIALALVPIPLWIKLMVPLSSFPLLFILYEWFAHGETIFTIEKELPLIAKRIAGLLDVPLVVFGHTHVPQYVPLGENSTYVNTGTWAPVWEAGNPHLLEGGLRNSLLVEIDADGKQAVSFASGLPLCDEGRRIAPQPANDTGVADSGACPAPAPSSD
jgi:UDP-2,3-diacylglucosamine pyrophosphatase LpxH